METKIRPGICLGESGADPGFRSTNPSGEGGTNNKIGKYPEKLHGIEIIAGGAGEGRRWAHPRSTNGNE